MTTRATAKTEAARAFLRATPKRVTLPSPWEAGFDAGWDAAIASTQPAPETAPTAPSFDEMTVDELLAYIVEKEVRRILLIAPTAAIAKDRLVALHARLFPMFPAGQVIIRHAIGAEQIRLPNGVTIVISGLRSLRPRIRRSLDLVVIDPFIALTPEQYGDIGPAFSTTDGRIVRVAL